MDGQHHTPHPHQAHLLGDKNRMRAPSAHRPYHQSRTALTPPPAVPSSHGSCHHCHPSWIIVGVRATTAPAVTSIKDGRRREPRPRDHWRTDATTASSAPSRLALAALPLPGATPQSVAWRGTLNISPASRTHQTTPNTPGAAGSCGCFLARRRWRRPNLLRRCHGCRGRHSRTAQ